MRSDRLKRLGLIATIVAGAVLALPVLAMAELSRDEYVARVEPICKTNVEANSRIFKGAKEKVKAGQLKQASGHFKRAATALGKTIKQIEGVPRPAADATKLQRWFDLLDAEQDYFQRIGDALAGGKKYKAQTLSVQLNRNSNKANNAILFLDFKECRIDPSRFS
jgi:hypothetical protein